MGKKLQGQQVALENLWKQGFAGHELLCRHSDMVDAFLVGHFTKALDSAKGKVALIALGGYGRRELYPFSDIDLLLLHDRKAASAMQELAEAVLYPLWDEGFAVGHSVRTVKDAVAFGAQDFIFQVALLDARLLAGSRKLFAELQESYQKKLLEKRRVAFVQTMERLRQERRLRYGAHSYILEPQIKEGKGGMRDIQAMLWVAKAVFGLHDLAALEDSGVLSSAERRDFVRSWNELSRIRNRLHYLSRRKNDQLIFEYQEEMAAAFGFVDCEGQRAVEQFMRTVYGHLQTVTVVTDLFFEHVAEVLDLAPGDRRELELEKNIVARSGTVRFLRGDLLAEKPGQMLRIFLLAAREHRPVHHRSRQMITEHLHCIDGRFRHSRRQAGVFLELLLQPQGPLEQLEAMLETGLLTAYLPEYAPIESLAQHDLYHIYTVDRHQLQTVAEVARLRREEAELFVEMPSPHLLYLAALLHDIGKGRQADHSALGAEMVEKIGRRLNLPPAECACLSFLVRYHLYMPENALRRDLEDQEFIGQAAELIGDPDRLLMLYLLSIADSRATGPSAWSEWKASLLAELFFRIRSCLAMGSCRSQAEPDMESDQGVAWLREQVAEKLRSDVPPLLPVADLPADYLLGFTPEMVTRHLHLHRRHHSELVDRLLLFAEPRHGSWSLLVMTRDRSGLLATIFGVLALRRFKVLAAQIFTWPDGTVVDVFDVAPISDVHFAELDWEALKAQINRALVERGELDSLLGGRLDGPGFGPRRIVQQLERKVLIDTEISSRFTSIEVHGTDRPDMLYRLARILSAFGLNVHRARIATEVEQLIVVFYVTMNGGKVEDTAAVEQLRTELLAELGA